MTSFNEGAICYKCVINVNLSKGSHCEYYFLLKETTGAFKKGSRLTPDWLRVGCTNHCITLSFEHTVLRDALSINCWLLFISTIVTWRIICISRTVSFSRWFSCLWTHGWDDWTISLTVWQHWPSHYLTLHQLTCTHSELQTSRSKL